MNSRLATMAGVAAALVNVAGFWECYKYEAIRNGVGDQIAAND